MNIEYIIFYSFYIYLDTMHILLQYPLRVMLNKIEVVVLLEDLRQLHLLSQKEIDVIITIKRIYPICLITRMVSETIINGDKYNFSKLTSYQKSYKNLAYLVEYWEKLRKLSLQSRPYNYLQITKLHILS